MEGAPPLPAGLALPPTVQQQTTDRFQGSHADDETYERLAEDGQERPRSRTAAQPGRGYRQAAWQTRRGHRRSSARC